MSWHKKIIGNKNALDYLEKVAESNLLPNAFLFVGPVGVGKFRIAKDFVKMLNRNDPAMIREIDRNMSAEIIMMGDLWQAEQMEDWERINRTSNFDQHHRMGSDGEPPRRTNTIGVRDIHSFLKPLYRSGSARWKAGVIRDAERMTIEAANALLKILEEPPTNTIFILTASHEKNLPETIVSRCQILRFALVAGKELSQCLTESNIEGDMKREALMIAQGRSEMIHRFIADPEFFETERQQFQIISRLFTTDFIQKMKFSEELATPESSHEAVALFLDNLLRFLRSIMIEKVSGTEMDIARKIPMLSVINLCEKVAAAKKELASNVNRRLLFENLFFSLPR